MVLGSVPAVHASDVSWEKVDRTIELSDRLIRKDGSAERDPAELVRVSIVMGFLEQDGKYYYLEHDTLAPKGIYTKLDFEMDTPYYGSAYFDGEMLYYSAYKESQNQVTLMAIDVAGGSKACYELGTFGAEPRSCTHVCRRSPG